MQTATCPSTDTLNEPIYFSSERRPGINEAKLSLCFENLWNFKSGEIEAKREELHYFHEQGGSSAMPLRPACERLTATPTRTYHSCVLCRWCTGCADVVHWVPSGVRSRLTDIRIIRTVPATTVPLKGRMSGLIISGSEIEPEEQHQRSSALQHYSQRSTTGCRRMAMINLGVCG